jgi:hypothetical protein
MQCIIEKKEQHAASFPYIFLLTSHPKCGDACGHIEFVYAKWKNSWSPWLYHWIKATVGCLLVS